MVQRCSPERPLDCQVALIAQIRRHILCGYELHFFQNQIPFRFCHAKLDLHRSFSSVHAPPLLSVLKGFGTLPNKQFSTDAPQRGRAKIRKWVPASYACYETSSLIPTTTKSPYLPKQRKRKDAAACNGCNASQSLFSFPFRLPKSLLPLLSVFAIPVRSYYPAARRAADAVCLSLRTAPGKRAGLRTPRNV